MKPSELKEGQHTEIRTNGVLCAQFTFEYGWLELVMWADDQVVDEHIPDHLLVDKVMSIRFNYGTSFPRNPEGPNPLTPEGADEAWVQIEGDLPQIKEAM